MWARDLRDPESAGVWKASGERARQHVGSRTCPGVAGGTRAGEERAPGQRYLGRFALLCIPSFKNRSPGANLEQCQRPPGEGGLERGQKVTRILSPVGSVPRPPLGTNIRGGCRQASQEHTCENSVTLDAKKLTRIRVFFYGGIHLK